MNNRGLDLKPADMIKAQIIGQLETTDEDEEDEYSERWENMEVHLGRDRFNDLFSYVRMIFAKEKAKKSLLEEFKTYISETIKEPAKFVSDVLEPYARALAIIRNANYEAMLHAEEINSHLQWLNRIDDSDWVPAAILFLSKNENNSTDVSLFLINWRGLPHTCTFANLMLTSA